MEVTVDERAQPEVEHAEVGDLSREHGDELGLVMKLINVPQPDVDIVATRGDGKLPPSVLAGREGHVLHPLAVLDAVLDGPLADVPHDARAVGRAGAQLGAIRGEVDREHLVSR